MEAFLDALIAFLVSGVSTSPAISWILGDPGQSAPTVLPMGYVVPLWDTVKELTASGIGTTGAASGIDMDTYAIPILVIDDLHAYGPPIAHQSVAGAFEQPGYRKLMQYGQTVRQALRHGGQGITVNGIAATSSVPALSYVWVTIDKKPYRGVRVALQAQQRRARI